MAIKLDCPRCKRPLSVPNKKAGGYANCPRCGGRFWVHDGSGGGPPDAEDGPPANEIVESSTTPEPPASGEKPQPTVSIGGAATVAPGQVVGRTSGGQKTARLVTAEAAQSAIQTTEDGKLPELHLRQRQNGRDKRKEEKTTTVNPLVLFGLLAISVVVTVALVMLDVEPNNGENADARQARKYVEDYYFPEDGQTPLDYQVLLMEAQQAHIRGDREAEREAYEKVLDLLRQERPVGVGDENSSWSLTHDDQRLKELIAVLLSNE
jgi:hypothetical protein